MILMIIVTSEITLTILFMNDLKLKVSKIDYFHQLKGAVK